MRYPGALGLIAGVAVGLVLGNPPWVKAPVPNRADGLETQVANSHPFFPASGTLYLIPGGSSGGGGAQQSEQQYTYEGTNPGGIRRVPLSHAQDEGVKMPLNALKYSHPIGTWSEAYTIDRAAQTKLGQYKTILVDDEGRVVCAP